MRNPSTFGGRFLKELRRRHVFRVAALFIVGAWLVIQAAGLFFPAWGIPDAAIRILLYAAVLGFPVALVFGWLFDVSATGIRRTKPAGGAELQEALPLRRADYLILTALTAALSVILYNAADSVLRTHRVQDIAGHIDSGLMPQKLDNSLAVLPFTNMSQDPDNEFFCNGITEEILNKLAAFPDLHVIGRTSSFAFKDSGYVIPKISELLGVRYLLQGSVRRDGDQLRIATQLVDESGVQIWSRSFDRELRDIFAIQSEIADVVAVTVAPQVSAQPQADRLPDLEAYQHYLTGRELVRQRDVDPALDQLRQAIALDPQFAEAYAELSIALALRAGWFIADVPGIDRDREFDRAQEAADTALSLSPDLARAHAAQGFLLLNRPPHDNAGAEAVLRRVLAVDPNMVDAMNWLGIALGGQGKAIDNQALMERATRIDPLHPVMNTNLANGYLARGEFARAERGLLRLLELPQQDRFSFFELREFYQITGRLVDMNAIEKRRAMETDNLDHYGLSLNYAMLGRWEAAQYWVKRSMREAPGIPPVPFYDALLPYWQGRHGEAAERFRVVLTSTGQELSEMDPTFSQWYGSLQALAGDHARAIHTLEPAIDLDARIYSNEDGGYVGINARQALAWAYLQTGAQERAQPILDAIDRQFGELQANGILHISNYLFLYAQNAQLTGDSVRVLDRLQQAIDAGWRDYYISHNDPRWASITSNARFIDLMAIVKADVDAQRKRVDQIDAEDDFVARLDQVSESKQATDAPLPQ